MKPIKNNGFTIVETMLFLGISGALIMGVLVGTGTSINTQRYRDSVTSLQSYLQKQYSGVANVSNDVMTNDCDGGSAARGQSECVILGKYITINGVSDDKKVNVKTVLGKCPISAATDDVTALQNCIITISDDITNNEEYTMEWGSSAVNSENKTLALSMLVLRSPSSGILRTFIITSSIIIPDNNISDILTETPSALNNSAKICVDSNGLFTGEKMSVDIDSNSTSASGVQTNGANSKCK